jgi:hypothetical protein
VSAAIIQFIPRPRRRGGPKDAIAVLLRPNHLTMDHADTAPCEYVGSCEQRWEGARRPDRKELR